MRVGFVGEKDGIVINDNASGTITGLSNTTWDATKVDIDRVATEGQLQSVATEASKHTTVSGDKNIAINHEEGSQDYQVTLKDNIVLGEDENQININGAPEEGQALLSVGKGKFIIGQQGDITATVEDTSFNFGSDGVAVNSKNGSTFIDGQSVRVGSVGGTGGIVINGNGSGTITGLTNTTLNVDGFAESKRAATEEQLQEAAAASKTTLSDGVNTTVISNDNTPDGHVDYQVNLNDNVYLGGNNKPGSSNIELDGENGTIQVGSNIILDSKEARAVIGGVDISTTFDDIGKKSSTITGLSNTTWGTDKVVIDRAATEGQLQMVSDKVTAGWTATDDAGNKINVNPETRPTLNFASGKNITVSANKDSGEVEVSLNDNINLNDRVYINGDPEEGNNTIVDIKSGNTSKKESIFAVEDKGNGSISIGGIDITNVDGPYLAVGNGKLKFYEDGGLSTGNATGTFSVRPDGDLEISGKNSSFDVDAETGNVNAINSSGSAIMMNDDSIALNASGNGVAISDEGILLNTNGIDEDIKLVTKGTSVSVDSNGTTFTNTNTNETTNINGGTINVGDKLVVDQNGTTTIAVNDGTVMGNNTTMTVNKDGVAFSAYGNGTTVIDGQTISAGGVVINNNGSGTINGLTNRDWDGTNYVSGQAATEDQLLKVQEAVDAAATEASKHTTVSGDENITVNHADGSQDYQVSLNNNITLADEKSSITLYTDSTPKNVTVTGKNGPETVQVTGYIPESYIDDQERVDNFISTHGGFMMYATDTSGQGVFGVTTDGMVHVKDVISYMPDPNSKDKVLRYSLNDVGDIVTQIAHGQYDGTGMEYTLISDFKNETDKEDPFEALPDEGDKTAERTIGLAIRQDGAVVVGAVVNQSGALKDSGIRINDGEATITGLENTEWKPKAPEQTPQAKMATFAANDETTTTTTTTSRAATEAQLDDLYNVVSVYNTFDNNGNVNYNTIKLRGDEYSYNEKNPVDSKGTSIINVAYASGTVGSEAVNVDYLNDAIAGVKTEASGSDKYLSAGAYDQESGKITLTVANSQDVVIDGIASKNDITNLDNKIDSINDKIEDINTAETDVKGGSINEDGTISLKTENDDGTTTDITLNGNLTDSGVIQDGTSFDGETGTLTITSQDKYSKETSSVTVSGIASKDDIGAVTDTIGVTSSEDLKDAYKDADKDGNATTAYITESESMVEADVALDHAIQDVANTGYANDMVLSNRIDSVEKRLGNVEERIDKVGAMAAAIANLRTMGFDPEAPTEIAIGVGQYKSETGIAIGVFHYPNQDFMLSASLSSSGDELMGGIGATWKLGRKSAAERAKDEEARHLEQAEEMKKLAQQEKVKAQAQRHAKLLAERQQASQKNA